MAWVIGAVVVLSLLFAGLFFGIRDIPPSGGSESEVIGGKNTIYQQAWKRVNEHFTRRNTLGR